MKNAFFFSTLLALILVVTSCYSSSDTNVKMKKTANYDLIKRADWLLGEWQNISSDSKTTEIWKKKNDSIYTAISYVIVMNDTVFYETITLEQRGEELFYIPTVSDQNNAQAIEFKMSSYNNRRLEFENLSHDFPQKISYRSTGTDSLVAIISGEMEGKFNIQEFPMGRVK